MMEEESVALETRVIVCTCGGHHFGIEISNGLDGKTHSLWLRCAQCGLSTCMRKIMKSMEEAAAIVPQLQHR